MTFSEITNLVEQEMVSYTTKVLKSFIIYIPTCKVNLHLHNAHEINFPESNFMHFTMQMTKIILLLCLHNGLPVVLHTAAAESSANYCHIFKT